jgi:plastocyanin
MTADHPSSSRARMSGTAARARRLLLAAAIVPFLLGPQAGRDARAAANGAIRGTVELRRSPQRVERRPGVTDLGMPATKLPPERQMSVVYLEAAPRGAFEQVEPRRAVLNQKDETFVPHVLAVTTGTIVDFPNGDSIYHNVFSLSKTRRFDLGRYAAGRSKSVRFDRPGIVRVFCDIHSHMNAFILVFSHPYFAVTDGDGRYFIDNVPAGTYRIVAWNEGTASEPRSVTVSEDATADVSFSLR